MSDTTDLSPLSITKVQYAVRLPDGTFFNHSMSNLLRGGAERGIETRHPGDRDVSRFVSQHAASVVLDQLTTYAERLGADYSAAAIVVREVTETFPAFEVTLAEWNAAKLAEEREPGELRPQEHDAFCEGEGCDCGQSAPKTIAAPPRNGSNW